MIAHCVDYFAYPPLAEFVHAIRCQRTDAQRIRDPPGLTSLGKHLKLPRTIQRKYGAPPQQWAKQWRSGGPIDGLGPIAIKMNQFSVDGATRRAGPDVGGGRV